jgi:integrase
VPMRPEHFDGITAYVASTGRSLASNGYLFLRSPQYRNRPGPIHTNSLLRRPYRLIERAYVDGTRVTVHSLPHMYALAVLGNSGNIVVVQKLLGHASVETTTR